MRRKAVFPFSFLLQHRRVAPRLGDQDALHSLDLPAPGLEPGLPRGHKKERDRSYWYYNEPGESEEWRKFDAGIGINGTTFRQFRRIVKKAAFSDVRILPTRIYSVGKVSLKKPLVRRAALLLKSVVRLPFVEDLLSHRIGSVLTQ